MTHLFSLPLVPLCGAKTNEAYFGSAEPNDVTCQDCREAMVRLTSLMLAGRPVVHFEDHQTLPPCGTRPTPGQSFASSIRPEEVTCGVCLATARVYEADPRRR